MYLIRKHSSTSNMFRVLLRDSTTGQGLTGLTFSSSGLIISTINDNEATPTAYTAAGATIETVTTLGTFAAPTATKVRFREVDATNHPGLYEVQIADARFAIASAKILRVAFAGATSLLSRGVAVQFDPVPSDVTHLLGTGWLTPAVAGTADVNTKTITTGAITAASIAADAVAEIQSGLSTLTQTQVTGGAYAINNASFAFNTGLDFTTTQKAATLARVTLNDTTTTNTDMRGTDNAALAATALSTAQWTNTLATNIGTTNTTVAIGIDATISSRMATFTQPTGFLAATFPATVASTTNITAATGITVSSIEANVVNASALAADAVAEIADGIWDEATSGHTISGTYGGRIVRATNSNVEVQITGSNHVAADVHEFQAGVITAGDFAANSITASALAADAVTEIQSGLATAANLLIVSDGVGFITSVLLGTISDAGTAGETYVITFGGATYTLDYTGLDATGNRTGVTRTKV